MINNFIADENSFKMSMISNIDVLCMYVDTECFIIISSSGIGEYLLN